MFLVLFKRAIETTTLEIKVSENVRFYKMKVGMSMFYLKRAPLSLHNQTVWSEHSALLRIQIFQQNIK